jgi:hypothetical protein
VQRGHTRLTQQGGNHGAGGVALHRNAHPGADVIGLHVGPQAHGIAHDQALVFQSAMRLVTVPRDTFNRAASVATDSRAFWRSSAISFWSVSSMVVRSIHQKVNNACHFVKKLSHTKFLII